MKGKGDAVGERVAGEVRDGEGVVEDVAVVHPGRRAGQAEERLGAV